MDTKEARPESKAAMKRREKAEAVARLREIFPPGSAVYSVLKHRSRSGMFRRIAFLAVRDGSPRNVSGLISTALDFKWYDDDSLGVSGCGMDMGFHVAYCLSRTLYPEGFGCIGEGCPSNDHSNGDRDYTPHGHRGPVDDGNRMHMHGDGGYALPHRWI
jgi:hypothetical protein